MAGQMKHSWNGTVLTIESDSGISSADLKGAKGDTGIRGPQGVMDYAKLAEYVKHSELIGVLANDYLGRKVKDIQGTATVQVKTRFADFNDTGGSRQTIFIFGSANNTAVYGLITVNNAGVCSYSGVGDISVEAKESGIIEITLPKTAYDAFTIISGQNATIL